MTLHGPFTATSTVLPSLWPPLVHDLGQLPAAPQGHHVTFIPPRNTEGYRLGPGEEWDVICKMP